MWLPRCALKVRWYSLHSVLHGQFVVGVRMFVAPGGTAPDNRVSGIQLVMWLQLAVSLAFR